MLASILFNFALGTGLAKAHPKFQYPAQARHRKFNKKKAVFSDTDPVARLLEFPNKTTEFDYDSRPVIQKIGNPKVATPKKLLFRLPPTTRLTGKKCFGYRTHWDTQCLRAASRLAFQGRFSLTGKRP